MRRRATLLVIGASVALLLGTFAGVGEPVEECDWSPPEPRAASFEVYKGGTRVVREAHFVQVWACRDGRTAIVRRR